MNIDRKYRHRIYKKYSSKFQDADKTFKKELGERFLPTFDYYFRGWLPEKKNSAIADLACGSGMFLYYLKRRGYRGFSINRPDKIWNKLSVTEKEIGGIPNTSEDIKQAHAAAIETYVNEFVGLKETGYGDVYFQRTLEDWAKFNINNRTKHDASISSGLALMACNKHRYTPGPKRERPLPVDLGIKKYDNKGSISKIIS